jgi:hypothetical protein
MPRPHSKPSQPRQPGSPRRLSVADGRDALGVVKLSAGVFTAIATDGTIVGTFASLREAARAFSDGGQR